MFIAWKILIWYLYTHTHIYIFFSLLWCLSKYPHIYTLQLSTRWWLIKKNFKRQKFVSTFADSDVIQEESQLPHAIRVYDVTEFSAGHHNIRRNSQCRRVCLYHRQRGTLPLWRINVIRHSFRYNKHRETGKCPKEVRRCVKRYNVRENAIESTSRALTFDIK